MKRDFQEDGKVLQALAVMPPGIVWAAVHGPRGSRVLSVYPDEPAARGDTNERENVGLYKRDPTTAQWEPIES